MAIKAVSARTCGVLLLILVGCGSKENTDASADASTADGSPVPCEEGELLCVGQEVRVCRGDASEFVETCPDDLVCAPGLGCRDCQPDRPFCRGREVRLCSSDGRSSTEQEECPPEQVCRGAECVNACALAEVERSNVGCDYMAVDLDNEFANPLNGGPAAASEQFAVVLGNPSDVAVRAMVFQSDGEPNRPDETLVTTVAIPPNDLARIDLPGREVDGSSPPTIEGPGTFLSNNAYRIRTDFPVVAYQFNPVIQSSSNDASLLLPVPALDVHYRVLGWPTANPIASPVVNRPGIPDHSYVTVVGTQPNTTVRVTLGGPIVAGTSSNGELTIPATQAGEMVEVLLGPYDVLNLESDMIPGDLTGTVVESTQPVAVFSGGERAIAPLTPLASAHPDGIPEDWCCTEHLEEQVFPTVAWGKEFVMTRSPVRSSHPTWREPDIYRVLADKPDTVVTTTLEPPYDRFSLEENEWAEFSADQPFVISATEAISIQQILVSQDWVVDWKPGHGGDPSMILFPPFEQFQENYVFLAPDTFITNYVVIAVPDGTVVTLDGNEISTGELSSQCEAESAGTVRGIAHTQITCPIESGTHRVESTRPIGVMVYGYHSTGSYGYAGGSRLTRINPLF